MVTHFISPSFGFHSYVCSLCSWYTLVRGFGESTASITFWLSWPSSSIFETLISLASSLLYWAELVDYYRWYRSNYNASVLQGEHWYYRCTHHLAAAAVAAAAAAATTTTTTTAAAVFPVHDFVCVLLHQWFAIMISLPGPVWGATNVIVRHCAVGSISSVWCLLYAWISNWKAVSWWLKRGVNAEPVAKTYSHFICDHVDKAKSPVNDRLFSPISLDWV